VEYATSKKITYRNCPTSGEFTWAKLAWLNVRSQPLWLERFGDQQTNDVYGKGRLLRASLESKWKMLEEASAYAGQHCHFVDPRFKAATFCKIGQKLSVIFEKLLDYHEGRFVKLTFYEALKLAMPRKKTPSCRRRG
jgi:hypothetical protein